MLQRVGQPKEVAKAIVFLLSDDASYISGSMVHELLFWNIMHVI